MKALENPFVTGLCVALLVCVAYVRSPEAAFQYDDHAAVLNALPFLDAQGLLKVWGGFPAGRPLTQTTLVFDAWRAGGPSARDFHVTNLVLHLMAAGLLYRLGLLLLGGRPGGAAATALGTLLFALHPLQAQAAGYVIQRSTEIAALGSLGMAICILKAQSGGSMWLLPAGISWLAGLSGKENAAAAPLLSLACLLLATSVPGARPRRRLLVFLLASLAVPWILFAGDLRSVWSSPLPVGAYAATQLWVVPQYVRLLLFPWPQSVIHHLPDLGGGGDPRLPWTVLAWTLTAGAAWALRRRPLALWAGAWWLCALLPESSGIPLDDRMMEHRVYLALAGPALAAGCLLASFQARRWGIPILLSLLGLATLGRGVVWAEPRLLWREACRISPGSQKAWINLGQISVSQGRFLPALRWTHRALEVRPGDPEALLNLGALHLSLGDPSGAERCWGVLTENASACFNLGNLCQEAGRIEEAEQGYLHAILLSNRRDLRALNALGALKAERGEPAPALALFEEVLSKNPSDPSALLNRGQVLAELGRMDPARESLMEAARLDPGDPLTSLALGRFHQGEADALWVSLPRPPGGSVTPESLRSIVEGSLAGKPEDPVAREILRRLDLAEQRWGQAAEAFRRTLVNPSRGDRLVLRSRERLVGEALERLGSIETVHGRIAEAGAYLRQALLLQPENARLRAYLEANPAPPAGGGAPERPFLPSDLPFSGPAPAPAAP